MDTNYIQDDNQKNTTKNRQSSLIGWKGWPAKPVLVPLEETICYKSGLNCCVKQEKQLNKQQVQNISSSSLIDDPWLCRDAIMHIIFFEQIVLNEAPLESVLNGPSLHLGTFCLILVSQSVSWIPPNWSSHVTIPLLCPKFKQYL